MRRTITLVAGAGFSLHFAGIGSASLARPMDRCDFAGEWTTRCSLVQGRVEVLNFMTDGYVPAQSSSIVGFPNQGTWLLVDARSRACCCILCIRGEGGGRALLVTIG